MSLLCFFVPVLLMDLALSGALSPPYASVKEWALSKHPDKFNIVKDYVHYKLYFSDKESEHICLPGGESNGNNATASLFAEAIDMCPVQKYSPRILSATQVSFKNNDQENPINNSRGNDTQKVPLNQSASPLSEAESEADSAGENILNVSTPGNVSDEENSNDKKDIIHEYLAIALVLPHHPFSRALVDSMRIIAPMYPSVTVYFGIATEFQNLCNQYGVRSYPKLLLFHKGLLVDMHANVNGQKYKPPKLAKRFSRWTNTLPRTDPAIHSPFEGKTFKAMLQEKDDHFGAPIMSTLEWQNLSTVAHVVQEWYTHTDMSQLLWAQSQNATNGTTTISPPSNVNFGLSIEPIVSLTDNAKAWDIPVYILSSLYVFFRMMYYIWTFSSTNGL